MVKVGGGPQTGLRGRRRDGASGGGGEYKEDLSQRGSSVEKGGGRKPRNLGEGPKKPSKLTGQITKWMTGEE